MGEGLPTGAKMTQEKLHHWKTCPQAHLSLDDDSQCCKSAALCMSAGQLSRSDTGQQSPARVAVYLFCHSGRGHSESCKFQLPQTNKVCLLPESRKPSPIPKLLEIALQHVQTFAFIVNNITILFEIPSKWLGEGLPKIIHDHTLCLNHCYFNIKYLYERNQA